MKKLLFALLGLGVFSPALISAVQAQNPIKNVIFSETNEPSEWDIYILGEAADETPQYTQDVLVTMFRNGEVTITEISGTQTEVKILGGGDAVIVLIDSTI